MAENASSSFIPQVDYTSRDYETIREDLLNLIPNYAPNWTNRDPSDFGVTLVELFSYMGDLLNFYIDRAASEGFLATASQRDSILRIASMLNYTPTESTPAVVELNLTNSSSTNKTVPAGTQIATSVVVNGVTTQVVFETDESVVVPAKVGAVNGTAVVDATQGKTVTQQLGTSNGNPNQIFKLSQDSVIIDSIQISVNGVAYSYSAFLIDNNIFDPVFTTFSDSEGFTYIQFGDGIGGRIPPSASTINATYRVGVGAAGNVPLNKLTFFLTNPQTGVTVNNNLAASGGSDPETTDSVRTNAPLALKSLNRAVSLQDYASLALQLPGVAKAVAEANVYSHILLFVKPFGDRGVVVSGGVSSTTAVFDNLTTELSSYFAEKAAPGTEISYFPPSYVGVDVEVTINLLPQYKQSILQNQALAVLREVFNIDNVFFADQIPLQYIMSSLDALTGVDFVTVEILRRTDAKQQFNVSNFALTSNVATVTTSAAHNFTIGQKVRIANVANAIFNGTFTVLTVPTSTTFTYAKTSATNVASTAASVGTALALVVETVTCAVNELPEEGTFTVNVSGGIN